MTIFLRSSVKREASDWNRLKADLYISESIVGPSPFNEYWQLEAIVAFLPKVLSRGVEFLGISSIEPPRSGLLSNDSFDHHFLKTATIISKNHNFF